MLHTYVYGID